MAVHQQRGRLQLNERLVYDSRIWKIVSNGGYSWQPTNVPGSMGGWSFYSGIEPGSVGYASLGGSLNCTTIYTGVYAPVPYTVNFNFNWTDPQGTKHSFPGAETLEYGTIPAVCISPSSYTQVPTGAGYASDGSGYSATVSNYTDVVIQDKEGNQFRPSVIMSKPSSTTPEVIDSNGNYWSQDSNGNLIDTLGRTPVQVSTSGNQTFYDVLGVNGVRNRYTVTTETVDYHTDFLQSAVAEASGSFTAIQSITLPDNSAYSFAYDSGTGSGNYGELTSVTLPSGGVIQYTYTNFLDSFKNMNRWVHTRVKDGGTTTFAPSTISNCSGSAGCQEKTVVTDPSNNDTVYTFNLDNGTLLDASSWNSGIDVYQGLSTSGGTKIKSLNTTYAYATDYVPNPSTEIQSPGTYVVPGTVTAATVLQDVALTAQTVTTLDSTGTVPTLVKVWDYYSGSAPSAPTRQTKYAYYDGFFPQQVTQLDGSGNQLSQTTYTYDVGTLASVSPAHSGAATTGARSNATTIAQWVNTTGTTLNTNVTYDTAGTVLTATDPNGTTTDTHDGTDTFTTTITPPTPSSGVSLPYAATYDPSTGLLLNETDPNGAEKVYTSYDWNGRSTQINYPDGGETTATYTQTRTSLYGGIGAAQDSTTLTEYDGYGRSSRLAIANGQSTDPYYQTDSCYDINGRLSFQTYQYQGIGWAAAKVCSGAGDTYTYDALGRVTKITHADGTFLQYSYTGRATKVIEESGVTKITQTDALGRITSVCEVSSSTLQGVAPGACGQDIAATGFLTTYTYSTDSAANQVTTAMQGVQQRVFKTDSLGRTASVSEPERGTTTYSYAYSGTAGLGLTVTRQRPQANQTNRAVLTATTTQYDALGRVVLVSYSDGTPSRGFAYDTDNYWAQAGTNLKGRLAITGTTAPGLPTWTGSSTGYDVMGRVINQWSCGPATCGTGYQASRPLTFAYDWAGNLTQASDAVSGTLAYTRSPAGEVTSITNDTYQNLPYNPPKLVSNVVNGPDGPVSYTLGNGRTVVNAYDQLGRATGTWVCNNGSTAAYCGSSQNAAPQLYGFAIGVVGSQVKTDCDNTVGRCTSLAYDGFNRPISQTTTTNTALNLAWTYDRYGNRLSQTVTAGTGFTFTGSFNAATNQLLSPYQYDAAGNMTDDTVHSYAYDAEGNITQVDGGKTAQYVYDAFDRRIQVQTPSATTEYVYDYGGRRVSSWLSPNNVGEEGRIYWDGLQLAYRSSIDGTTYFDHQDTLGTERERTNYAGSVESSYPSGIWGDDYTDTVTSSGAGQDNARFAGLEYDAASGTEHAQFRNYSPAQGRWLSPDPYDGSYDFTNPQSFNRYSYVQNNTPLFADPSGQDVCGVSAAVDGGLAVSGPLGWATLGSCIVGDIFELFDLFGGPSFHGSLQPRPDSGWDGNFGESLGIPTSIPQGQWGVGLALGVPSDTCEFGACGAGPSALTPGLGGGYPSAAEGYVVNNAALLVWAWKQTWKVGSSGGITGMWTYGNWCGAGGSGDWKDGIDYSCMLHDYCYAQNGFSLGDNRTNLPGNRSGLLQGCNQNLCNSVSQYGGSAAWQIKEFFGLYPYGANACH